MSCLRVWLLSIGLDIQVNKLHERVLRIVYQDYASSFTELLDKDNSATIHNRSIQLLATELFKVKNGLSPPSIEEIFVKNTQHYDLRKTLNLREIMLKRYTAELNFNFRRT